MIPTTKFAAGRTFETNLSNSQKEEMEAQKAYEDLKAAKEAEIAAGQDQVPAPWQQLESALPGKKWLTRWVC